MLLIHMCVINSQERPQVSDKFSGYSKRMFYLDHVRHERNALTNSTETIAPPTTTKSFISASSNLTTTKSTISAPSKSTTKKSTISAPSKSTTTKSTISAPSNSTTTKSTISAPSNATTTTTATSNKNSITTTPPTTSSSSTAYLNTALEPLNEYLVEMDISMLDPETLNLLRNHLESISTVLINSKMNITDIMITTVCLLNGTDYQCRCEDQYSWPYEKCIENEYCGDITDGKCGCINTLPKDGQFCQLALYPVPQTDYLVEIDIAMIDTAAVNLLRNTLGTLTLPLISSYTIITKINLTTVCLLNGTKYQCNCEDQYSWPYETCIENGYCDDITDGMCGCINSLPDDAQFCRPISELAMPQTDHLVEIEIAMIDTAALILLRNTLKTLSLPLISSYTIITEINITTVCLLSSTDYQCRCEDQYSWPYEKCIENKYCDEITNGTCGCINAIPNDRRFCQPISEMTMPQTDYLVEIEIDTIDPAAVDLLKNYLKTFSLPLISSNIIISDINITTVCILNATEYQCRCEDQYSWPCEMCSVYGSCENINTLCSCINAIPNDGRFCQPIREMTNISTCINETDFLSENVITFSLKINENFDLKLINMSSEKYKRYKKIIEDTINKGYNTVSAYKTNSITVTGFRPGSVITDFGINTTSDNLNLVSANQQVITSLREQGFNISDDAFSRTVKDGLYRSTSQIYPENDLILTCKTTNDSITWTKDGNKLVASDKYIINKTSLIVKDTTPKDAGVYDCRTTENLMPYIIWQSFMIPDPNIQVNISKVLRCENASVRLQCCVLPHYNVTWLTVSSDDCSEPVQENSCIYCDHRIKETECRADDHNVTVTCILIKSSYSRSVSIATVNRAFGCTINSTNNAFGAGYMHETITGDCNGDMIGYQIAQCVAPGNWIVTYDNCVTRVIKYLYDISPKLLVTDLPTFAKNLSNAAVEKASEITKSPATILTIVELLKKIADLSQTVFIDEEIMTDFLKTLDVIGSTDAQDAWLYLNKNSTTMTKSSELLNSTERIAHRLQNGSFNISTNYTSLQKYDNIFEPFIETFGKNLSTEINIPTITTPTSLTVIVSSVFINILPVRNLTYNDSSQTGTTINGDVAVIQTNSTINNISLSFNVKNKTLGNPQCVFWNFNLLNGVGGWDSTGCQLKTLGNKSERYTCECDHLTSFSILMSPFSPVNCALDIITYIGVGISMGSLVLCLVIECIIWKSVRKGYTSYLRHVAIVNIAVSLLIANICFIIGAAVVKKNEGSCNAATFFMHFFYLAVFFWMLLSALLLLYGVFTMVNKISRGSMTSIGFTVGYGAPFLIAIITVASTAGRSGYIRQGYNCWLNWKETKALLAFVIPALTIVAINLLVLIVVLCKMLRRGVNSAAVQPDEKHPLQVIARCVAILTPLFGLTWGFGIGTMVSGNCGVHVVFAFLNSLQGFFILLFGTLLDRKVREALTERLALTSLSSIPTGSSNAASSSGGLPFITKLRKRNAHNIS